MISEHKETNTIQTPLYIYTMFSTFFVFFPCYCIFSHPSTICFSLIAHTTTTIPHTHPSSTVRPPATTAVLLSNLSFAKATEKNRSETIEAKQCSSGGEREREREREREATTSEMKVVVEAREKRRLPCIMSDLKGQW